MDQKQDKTLVDVRAHALYTGVTLSGKTTLARHHAQLLIDADYDVVVYDPVGTLTINGSWPPKCAVFDDPTKFLDWLENYRAENDRPTFVVVDESADIFGHANVEAHWIPRRVRHQNVYLRLIAQRPKMLPPNVRSQCAYTYMFRLADDDLRVVLADAGHNKSVVEKQLDTGDFILLVSGTSEIVSGNVFELCDS